MTKPGQLIFFKASRKAGLFFMAMLCWYYAIAQDMPAPEKIPVKDMNDVFRAIFGKKKKDSAAAKGMVILPSFGYNPSFGFVLGAKTAGSRQLGNAATTSFSVFGLEALYTSRGIITLKARHNLFTSGNIWNWQGNWQLSKFGMIDYGLGTGNGKYRSDGFAIDLFPLRNADSAFPIQYNYIQLFEKGYRKVADHLFVGGGLSFDVFWNIHDHRREDGAVTPHFLYSLRKGFNASRYSANGWLLAVQYNTREHPIRSYGGVYADLSVRVNQRWMGSTANAVQLQYDLRKYWSLSPRHPEHVLALWHWAGYLLSGELPYLAMPYTASDAYNRSGRGYTLGRFKGPSYACFEAEYRFPILRNQLVSGVAFTNWQTASSSMGKNVFSYWEPGYGAGLRILFQKESRSSICMDFARGRYGSSGIFFGLNEVF